MFEMWNHYLLPRGGVHKLSDDNVVKQYPFDLKAEATAQGYRIHGHVYSDSMEDAVTDLAKMIIMAITEFESQKPPLPLVINAEKKIK
jgi:hypothetical protein